MTQQNQNNKINPIVYFFICLAAIVSFDILLTNYILKNIFTGNDYLKLIDIVYVQNTGAAFSSFQQFTTMLVVVAIAAIIGIIWELVKNKEKYTLPFYFAFAALIGGISCNTYERITFGYVRDFLSFRGGHFPVFNVSDILINLAVLAIIILIVTKKYKRS